CRDGGSDVEVGAQEDLVDLEHVGAGEHLLRRTALVRLGESGALRPGDEVIEAMPPCLHLVEALRLRIIEPLAGLVIELDGSRSVHLVAHEARSLVDEVRTPLEAILEVDLVSLGNWNAIRDDDHARGSSTVASRMDTGTRTEDEVQIDASNSV